MTERCEAKKIQRIFLVKPAWLTPVGQGTEAPAEAYQIYNQTSSAPS